MFWCNMTVTRILSCASRWVLSPPFHLICQSALPRHSQGKQLSSIVVKQGGLYRLMHCVRFCKGMRNCTRWRVPRTIAHCTFVLRTHTIWCTKCTIGLLFTNPLVQKSYLAYSTIGIAATAGCGKLHFCIGLLGSGQPYSIGLYYRNVLFDCTIWCVCIAGGAGSGADPLSSRFRFSPEPEPLFFSSHTIPRKRQHYKYKKPEYLYQRDFSADNMEAFLFYHFPASRTRMLAYDTILEGNPSIFHICQRNSI